MVNLNGLKNDSFYVQDNEIIYTEKFFGDFVNKLIKEYEELSGKKDVGDDVFNFVYSIWNDKNSQLEKFDNLKDFLDNFFEDYYIINKRFINKGITLEVTVCEDSLFELYGYEEENYETFKFNIRDWVDEEDSLLTEYLDSLDSNLSEKKVCYKNSLIETLLSLNEDDGGGDSGGDSSGDCCAMDSSSFSDATSGNGLALDSNELVNMAIYGGLIPNKRKKKEAKGKDVFH